MQDRFGTFLTWLRLTFRRGGRMGRVQFLLASVFLVLSALLALIVVVILAGLFAPKDSTLFSMVAFSLGLLLLAPVSGLGVITLVSKRLHDLGRSSWWIGAAIIALAVAEVFGGAVGAARAPSGPGSMTTVHQIFLIFTVAVGAYLALAPGEIRTNRFGAPPGTERA